MMRSITLRNGRKNSIKTLREAFAEDYNSDTEQQDATNLQQPPQMFRYVTNAKEEGSDKEEEVVFEETSQSSGGGVTNIRRAEKMNSARNFLACDDDDDVVEYFEDNTNPDTPPRKKRGERRGKLGAGREIPLQLSPLSPLSPMTDGSGNNNKNKNQQQRVAGVRQKGKKNIPIPAILHLKIKRAPSSTPSPPPPPAREDIVFQRSNSETDNLHDIYRNDNIDDDRCGCINNASSRLHKTVKILRKRDVILILLSSIMIICAICFRVMSPSSPSTTTLRGNQPTSFYEDDEEEEKWSPFVKQVQMHIVKKGISSQSNFQSADSPQSRALRWLLSQYEDYYFNYEKNDGGGASALPHFKVSMERYALAVLYFSMHLPDDAVSKSLNTTTAGAKSTRFDETRLTRAWMSSYNICTWTGVSCQQHLLPKQQSNPQEKEGELFDAKKEEEQEEQESADLPSSVTGLNLKRSQLIGSIPHEILALKNLNSLDLSQNRISGGFDVLCSLTELEEVRLFENNFGSKIPRCLSGMTKLRHLNMHSTMLIGTLPSDLGRLGHVEYLNFRSNPLVGHIHPELGSLSRLEKFYLYHTNLSSTMPESICDLRHSSLQILSADCGGNKPKFNCSCCTHCLK